MPESHGEYERPQGWRFGPFGGVNVRNVPDALPPTKYAAAKNVRGTSSMALQTRPGYQLLFQTGGQAVTDLKAYAALGTDDLPRILARDAINQIWLDDGTMVALLQGAPSFGAIMLPVRPPASPQTWMYCASLGDYQKISPPVGSTPPVAYKVGIAEPPTVSSISCGLDAVAKSTEFTDFSGTSVDWTQAGTAGAPSNTNRVTDTAGAVLPLFNTQQSVQVTAGKIYQKGELLLFGGINTAPVLDVLPAIGTATVQAIRYDSGSTGSCTIVPSQLPIDQVSEVAGLGSLRRGALIQIGTEVILVQGTAIGQDGTIAIYASTTSTHAVGDAITGVPAIVVDASFAISAGFTTISGDAISSAVTTGVGTITRTLSTSPFSEPLTAGSSTSMPTEDDYLHFSIRIDDPTMLNEIRVQFNCDPTDNTFTQNIYTYAVQPSLLAPVLANQQTTVQAELGSLVQSTAPVGLPAQTAAGKSQWVEILIPVSALDKLGDDQTATLVNCRAVQVLVNCSGNCVVGWGSLYVCGGSAPDVGDDGADYMYRAVPRNSATGAKGNPTATMRYGVRPRRQTVKVSIPDSSYDPQIDTWDFYRIGGSVTSYRYIGSAPTATTLTFFLDNYFDDNEGDAMETDNLEPWPSIDVPFRVTTADATILPQGTYITVSGFSNWPSTIDRWLPGTLIQLGAQSAYTLRSRPVKVTSAKYVFEVEEPISPTINPAFFTVQEPNVARQILPYIFGPDVNGTVFAAGDPLRPDVLSFTKPGQPDSAPSGNTIRLSQPSEPLLGGVIKGGVAIAASTIRWWALYPQQNGYNQIEQSVGRGLVAPFAMCTDGARVYFWTYDGICATDGSGVKDLTSDDWYNLFPHEGIQGVNVTRLDLTAQGGSPGVTYYAPGYVRPGTFRLARINKYLFADYQDTQGNPRTLVMDIETGGWQTDVYYNPMTTHYKPEQQPGYLESTPQLYALGLLASADGKVWTQSDCIGDNSQRINCIVGTFEWDGGDPRALEYWGDGYLDCVPIAGITVTPVSFGEGAAVPTVITAGSNRSLAVINVGGATLQKFMGLKIEWSE